MRNINNEIERIERNFFVDRFTIYSSRLINRIARENEIARRVVFQRALRNDRTHEYALIESHVECECNACNDVACDIDSIVERVFDIERHLYV